MVTPQGVYMQTIKKVAVLGGNGTMGSLSGGLFAQAGIACIFFAPSREEAQDGIENAVRQARSDVIRDYILPESFESLEKMIPDCDWILEAVSENLSLKQEFFHRVDPCRKEGSIVSSMSSGLSIEDMAHVCSDDFKKHFMGVHFFNPPGRLPATELTFHPLNADTVRKGVFEFCEKTLRRVNIITCNRPAFAGNRIGFQFLNEAAHYAARYGVEMIDYLLGPHTGRALPPLATINLVGLDVHEAIVDNIYKSSNDERHETFLLPDYIQKMIERKMLGLKSGQAGGLYRIDEKRNESFVIDPSSLEHRLPQHIEIDTIEKMKLHIHDGEYRKALSLMKDDDSEPLSLVNHFIAGYISYSYSRVGEVTPVDDGIHGIDRVMAYGFSWLPPSAWVDFFGGSKEAVKLLERSDTPVPEQLADAGEGKQCRVPEVTKYFLAH
jgi:3-hydroxyacyl-CoA dehydrogenase